MRTIIVAFGLLALTSTATAKPGEMEGAARDVINAEPFTDAELEEAAMNAAPNSEDAHAADEEAMLDSGPDAIRFSAPDDDEPVKK